MSKKTLETVALIPLTDQK